MNFSHKIDFLNIILIVFSLLFAMFIPFELFLFSYAILGPLHYLTEINWLHQKNYFVKEKKYVPLLWLFATIIVALILSRYVNFNHNLFFHFRHYSNAASTILIISCLLFSIGLILFRESKKIIWSLFFAFLLGMLLLKIIPFSFIIVATLLPTVVHVYLFTLLFMIMGTRKNSSIYGKIAIVTLCLIPFIIFLNPISIAIAASDTTKEYFLASGFKNLILLVNQIVNNVIALDFNFNSKTIIKVQTFIAFAYTYHYLNWFSKTAIIGWNKNLSKTKLLIIISIWALSVGIYFYNYRIGIIALLFLSMSHVIVEFPLNIITIKDLFSKKKKQNTV